MAEKENLIEDAQVEPSEDFKASMEGFTNDLAQLLRKYDISFMNRDAMDEGGKYLFTQIFVAMKGELWTGDDFIEILEEALMRAYEIEEHVEESNNEDLPEDAG